MPLGRQRGVLQPCNICMLAKLQALMDAVEADEFQAAEEFDVSMAVLESDTAGGDSCISTPPVRSSSSRFAPNFTHVLQGLEEMGLRRDVCLWVICMWLQGLFRLQGLVQRLFTHSKPHHCKALRTVISRSTGLLAKRNRFRPQTKGDIAVSLILFLLYRAVSRRPACVHQMHRQLS